MVAYLPRSIESRSAGRCRYRYSCTCRHAQATIPPSSLRWVVCTRPAHPPSLAAKAFSGLGPRLSHCIRAHIPLFLASPRLSPRQAEAGARRAGGWCGTPDLLELVASRSAIDLLFRRGLLVSGKFSFATMVFSLSDAHSLFVHRCVRSFSFGSFPPISQSTCTLMYVCMPSANHRVVSPFTTTITSTTLRRLISLQVSRVPVPFGSVSCSAQGPREPAQEARVRAQRGHCIALYPREGESSVLPRCESPGK